MAFSASEIEITLRYTLLGENCQTARTYSWDGAAIAAATAPQLGEAWWNHYKDAWRALAPPTLSEAQFLSVLVREVGGSLSYGEFAVPTDEQEGDRAGTLAALLPSSNALGVRLTVGSLVTRPGQMRVPFLNELDTSGNDVGAGFQALAEDLATLYSQSNILGAPTATGVITPLVVRFGADNDTVLASQEIVGFVINPFATTQVTRRKRHGS